MLVVLSVSTSAALSGNGVLCCVRSHCCVRFGLWCGLWFGLWLGLRFALWFDVQFGLWLLYREFSKRVPVPEKTGVVLAASSTCPCSFLLSRQPEGSDREFGRRPNARESSRVRDTHTRSGTQEARTQHSGTSESLGSWSAASSSCAPGWSSPGRCTSLGARPSAPPPGAAANPGAPSPSLHVSSLRLPARSDTSSAALQFQLLPPIPVCPLPEERSTAAQRLRVESSRRLRVRPTGAGAAAPAGGHLDGLDAGGVGVRVHREAGAAGYCTQAHAGEGSY